MNKPWIRYWDILSGLFDRIEGWEGVEEHQALKNQGRSCYCAADGLREISHCGDTS